MRTIGGSYVNNPSNTLKYFVWGKKGVQGVLFAIGFLPGWYGLTGFDECYGRGE